MAKHHFVQQATLRRFSIGGKRKRVWVYDKLQRKSFANAIGKVGCGKDFNVLEADDGSRIDLEPLFDGIDGAAPSVIGTLLKEGKLSALSESNRSTLYEVVAVQFLRTNFLRDGVRAFAHDLKNTLEEADLTASPQPVELTDDDARRISFSMLDQVPTLVRHLHEKAAALLRFPAGGVWIGDNPVVLFNAFPYGDTAFASPGVEIYYPLSSHSILAFYCPSIVRKLIVSHASQAISSSHSELLRSLTTGEPMDATEHLPYFNQLQLAAASRQIYAARDPFEAADRVIQSNPSLAEPRKITQLGKMGQAPTRQNYPPGTHLVAIAAHDHFMVPVAEWERGEGEVEFKFRLADVDYPAFLASEGPYDLCILVQDKRETIGVGKSKIESLGDGWGQVLHSDASMRALTKAMREENSRAKFVAPE